MSTKRSLFGYYVSAALIAARMGISLDYAFKKYVKPTMPDEDIELFTQEEARELFSSDLVQQ
jgi:hypothetical protein